MAWKVINLTGAVKGEDAVGREVRQMRSDGGGHGAMPQPLCKGIWYKSTISLSMSAHIC